MSLRDALPPSREPILTVLGPAAGVNPSTVYDRGQWAWDTWKQATSYWDTDVGFVESCGC